MKRALLLIQVEEIMVKSNGDLPSDKQGPEDANKEKNNSIIATLTYPRSGAPNVVSTKTVNLTSGETYVFNTDFWKSGLFKEEVQGETILNIQVTDRDQKSKLEKIVGTIVGVMLGAALGGPIGGGVLGAVANFGVGKVKGAIAASEDESIEVVGEARRKLVVGHLPASLKLTLKAPATIKKKYFTFARRGSADRVVEKEIELLRKGAANGEIVLRLSEVDLFDAPAGLIA